MRWCCRPQLRGCCFCFFSLGLSLQSSSNEKQNQDHSTRSVGGFKRSAGVTKETEKTRCGLGKWVSAQNLFISSFVKMFGLDSGVFFFWTSSSLPHHPGHCWFLQEDDPRSPWQPNVAIISVTGSYIVHSSSCDSPRGRSACLTAHGHVRLN